MKVSIYKYIVTLISMGALVLTPCSMQAQKRGSLGEYKQLQVPQFEKGLSQKEKMKLVKEYDAKMEHLKEAIEARKLAREANVVIGDKKFKSDLLFSVEQWNKLDSKSKVRLLSSGDILEWGGSKVADVSSLAVVAVMAAGVAVGVGLAYWTSADIVANELQYRPLSTRELDAVVPSLKEMDNSLLRPVR